MDGLVTTIPSAEARLGSGEIEDASRFRRGRCFQCWRKSHIALGESHAQRMNYAVAVSNRVAHPFARCRVAQLLELWCVIDLMEAELG